MKNDENSGSEIGRERSSERSQGLNAACRRADHDDVALHRCRTMRKCAAILLPLAPLLDGPVAASPAVARCPTFASLSTSMRGIAFTTVSGLLHITCKGETL